MFLEIPICFGRIKGHLTNAPMLLNVDKPINQSLDRINYKSKQSHCS